MRRNLAQIAAQDGERCRSSRPTTPRLIVETQAKRRSRWVTRFVDSGDPLVIGQQVYTRDRARRAFADMLWAHTIEVDVEQRR